MFKKIKKQIRNLVYSFMSTTLLILTQLRNFTNRAKSWFVQGKEFVVKATKRAKSWFVWGKEFAVKATKMAKSWFIQGKELAVKATKRAKSWFVWGKEFVAKATKRAKSWFIQGKEFVVKATKRAKSWFVWGKELAVKATKRAKSWFVRKKIVQKIFKIPIIYVMSNGSWNMITKYATKGSNFFLDSFFNFCPMCDEESGGYEKICSNCRNEIQINEGCFICGKIKDCFCGHKSYIPFKYENKIQSIVLKFKNQNPYLAKILAKLILEHINIEKTKNTFLVPVGISRQKLFQREYNQSFELCKAISNLTDIPISPFVFKKTKNTTQKSSNSEQRKINASSIVLDDYSQVEGQHVILVDDVVASGSTLIRCKELLESKVKTIDFLAIAKS